MKRVLFACAAAAALVCASGPASADPLTRGGVTMEEVASILRARGLPALVSVDDQGDPKVVSKANGVDFDIICYPNAAKRDLCGSIQFSAAFDLADGTTHDKINVWNKSRRYGQAWLDDEMDPYIDMNVELERGASTELIEEYVSLWMEMTVKWREYFGVVDESRAGQTGA